MAAKAIDQAVSACSPMVPQKPQAVFSVRRMVLVIGAVCVRFGVTDHSVCSGGKPSDCQDHILAFLERRIGHTVAL